MSVYTSSNGGVRYRHFKGQLRRFVLMSSSMRRITLIKPGNPLAYLPQRLRSGLHLTAPCNHSGFSIAVCVAGTDFLCCSSAKLCFLTYSRTMSSSVFALLRLCSRSE